MAATLPLATVDVTLPPLGTQVVVAPGGLQAALNAAALGTTLVLTAGATYQGPFTLPTKTGAGWIVVTTSAALPVGVRVTPDSAAQMPKIVGGLGSVPAIATVAGAHHYRFIGIEVAPASGSPYNTGLIRLGTGSETTLPDLPHDLIFDRCYIHGDPVVGGKRGIAANAASVAVIDSYLSDWHVGGYDTQAFASWGGPGPFLLRNSYFEASGENVMFGGADTTIPNLTPSDITIVGNDFDKPLAWRGAPDASVKNLFELKHARRVLIDRNTFSHNWADAQTGTAINLKSANQDGTNPWAITEHVTFTNNRVQHAGGGLAISTQTDGPASQTIAHVLVRGNVFEDIRAQAWAGSGQFLTLLGPAVDITIDGNWCDQDGNILLADGAPVSGFVCTNNVVRHNVYGVKGSGTAVGTGTLDTYCPGWVFMGNTIVGPVSLAPLYPVGNTFVAALPPAPVLDPWAPPPPPPPPPPSGPSVTLTVPADRTVTLNRRAGDRNKTIVLTVNHSDVVDINGVRRL